MELDWIESEKQSMIDLVVELANICSGSGHTAGIDQVITTLLPHFKRLGSCEVIPLPPKNLINGMGEQVEIPVGSALHVKKRPEAPIQLLLVAHLDTVFGPDSSFQECKWLDENTLHGPGVSDIKGGIVILLKALEMLEKSGQTTVGWEVVLNPDEEIGSTSSYELLMKRASKSHIGLVFEPALPDGTMISERKGSANGIMIMRGTNAHVGREFEKGDNAIAKLAAGICEAHALNRMDGLTLNVGSVDGGGPLNVVPDFASCGINLRVENKDNFDWACRQLEQIAGEGEWIIQHYRPPKPFDPKTQRLFSAIHKCGQRLGQQVKWQPSGGVCDGNILAEAGLPTIDTLGGIGGKIHTTDEYLLVESLVQKAQLTASFMMQLASGELKLEEITHGHNPID